MAEIIKSTQNPQIKKILGLREAKNRKKENLIIIEGEREIYHSILGRMEITHFYHCPSIVKNKYPILEKINPNLTQIVSEDVFNKISYRDNPDGYLALAKPKKMELGDIKVGKKPLLIVLENVEKPGNLGAVLRTADGVGADAVIICDQQTDIYNPNVIRASMGTVFTKQVAIASNLQVIDWLKSKKIKIFSTWPETNNFFWKEDFFQPTAIIFGAEDVGLSKDWLEASDRKIAIPMNGKIDSLNISNSVAIIAYEVMRQRSV